MFNSVPLGVAYMRQWIVSVLVQLMACRQAIISTNAGLLSKMHLKISSAKRRPYCPGGGMSWYRVNKALLIKKNKGVFYKHGYLVAYWPTGKSIKVKQLLMSNLYTSERQPLWIHPISNLTASSLWYLVDDKWSGIIISTLFLLMLISKWKNTSINEQA